MKIKTRLIDFWLATPKSIHIFLSFLSSTILNRCSGSRIKSYHCPELFSTMYSDNIFICSSKENKTLCNLKKKSLNSHLKKGKDRNIERDKRFHIECMGTLVTWANGTVLQGKHPFHLIMMNSLDAGQRAKSWLSQRLPRIFLFPKL